MTNVDFFSGFAAFQDSDPVTYIPVKSEVYHFEHDTELQEASVFMSDVDYSDTQKKMFHFTNPNGIRPVINDAGRETAVEFSGSCLVLVRANIEENIHVQNGTDASESRYSTNVKPMVDKGGIIKEIRNYAEHLNKAALDLAAALLPEDFGTYYTLRTSNVTEVYAELDLFGDGIIFEYTLTIQHDPQS